MMLEKGKAYITPVVPGAPTIAQIVIVKKFVEVWDVTLTAVLTPTGFHEVMLEARREYSSRSYLHPVPSWNIGAELPHLAEKVQGGEAAVALDAAKKAAPETDDDSEEETEDAF